MTDAGRADRQGTLADRLTTLGYAAGWQAIRAVPEKAALAGAYLAADRAFRRRGPRVIQYAKNLHRVLSHSRPTVDPVDLAEVTRAGMRSYARFWIETFRLPTMDPVRVAAVARETTYGLEHLDRAVDAGRGVVLALPHSGNWDVAGLFAAQYYGTLTSVAERLKPETMYRKFVAYREALGMEILPLTGAGSERTSSRLKERLRAGGIVCLVADRDLTASGIPVNFFGGETRMPAGPAMLAAVTGAELCPVHLSFTKTGWAQFIRPPIELPGRRLTDQVRGGTQLLADAFAAGVAETPHDWHMLQPLWLADVDPARLAKKAPTG